MADPKLNPCPRCGGKAIFKVKDGCWGYYPPSLYVACENYNSPVMGLPDKSMCFVKSYRISYGERGYPKETKVKKLLAEIWNDGGRDT